MTVRRLYMAVLFVSIFALAAQENVDPDFWWHLRTGQLIWETRSVPRTDPFSYTIPNRPWTAHEWLSEVLLYGLFQLSGQEGLILAFAGLITASFFLLYREAEGKPYLAGLVVLGAALASAISWGVRPQMISLFLTALFLWVLGSHRRGHTRWVWWLPAFTALWANLHGGFVLGLAVLGAYLVGGSIERGWGRTSFALRPFVGALGLSIPAALITPHGLSFFTYPFATLYSPTMQAYIVEWQSPDFHQNQFQAFAALLLMVPLAWGLSRRPLDAVEILLMVGLGYASLRSARLIPLFALAAIPTLSQHLNAAWKRSVGGQRFLTAAPPSATSLRVGLNLGILVLVIAGATVKVGAALANNAEAQRKAYPVEAVNFMIEKDLQGNLFNQYEWGGYLIWRLYPRQQVFIDGRADVYGDAYIESYLDAFRLREDWRVPLERYDIDLVLINRHSALASHLETDPAWERVYSDPLAVIFVKREGSAT
ncbi:MAG: hypothetical protein HYZ68_03755 [Chloroflexi bacterium]|nr:hypothetical protein [Chloroflexota bacterium]